jgi:hypothetical protein
MLTRLYGRIRCAIWSWYVRRCVMRRLRRLLAWEPRFTTTPADLLARPAVELTGPPSPKPMSLHRHRLRP